MSRKRAHAQPDSHEELMVNPADEADDDYELELEGVDPEVLAHARERAARQVQETEARAERLETFEAPSEADALELDDLKSFRFTTRHLLVATAVLAVIMSLARTSGCNGLFFGGLAILAFGWWWVLKKERDERRERERRRLEIEARIAAAKGQPSSPAPRMAGLEPADEELPPEKPALTFSFSFKQLFWAFTVVGLVLALTALLGTQNASWMLGAIAVLGLAIHAMGFELPGIIVFGWWVLLVLYVLMSLAALFMSSP
jgi:hypothetical protein